jgi:hypothetical protein
LKIDSTALSVPLNPDTMMFFRAGTNPLATLPGTREAKLQAAVEVNEKLPE